MLTSFRFGLPCVLLAVSATLVPACSGGSSSMCSGLCDLLVKCGGATSSNKCTFADDSAASDACASACESGLSAIPASEAAAVTACFSCAVDAAAGSCTDFQTGGMAQCASQCSSNAFAKAAQDWGDAVDTAAAGQSALVCTDGENPFGETCDLSSSGSTGCVISCCNGKACGPTPDVQITCSGTMDGQLSCTCTEGKSKGKVVSATTCDAATSLDPWATCNQ